MATDEVYPYDPLTSGSFSELLFDDSVQSFNFYSPQMLCFGENRDWYDVQLVQNSSTGVASSNSPPLLTDAKPNKRRNGALIKESQMKQDTGNGARDAASVNKKKTKAENSTLFGHAKTQVKKQKLGERITALQQIVSPFGKTDTASVLHEATGYIRFLHDQLQVLSSPYLHPLATSARLSQGGEKSGKEVERRELRSRGLCLIPVELLTSHVAESNGADFWSPAMVENVSSTSL